MSIHFHIFIIICVLSLTPLFGATDNMSLGNTGVMLDNFQTNGRNFLKNKTKKESQSITWLIRGRRALVREPLYDIQEFEMTLDSASQGHHLITSPYCQFHKEDLEVHSPSSIKITGDGLQMSGIGYDIYWDDNEKGLIIVIRSTASLTMEEDFIDNQREQ